MKTFLGLLFMLTSAKAFAFNFELNASVPFRLCGGDVHTPTECYSAGKEIQSGCDTSKDWAIQQLQDECAKIGGKITSTTFGKSTLDGTVKRKTLICYVPVTALCESN